MHERIKHMKEILMCAVECQLEDLEGADAKELGEVVDMIKDLEEAEYYHAVVKAMEEAEEEEHDMMYYPPIMYYGGRKDGHGKWKNDGMSQWHERRTEHDNGWYAPHQGDAVSEAGHMAYYTEKEFPHAFDDQREGRSYRARRTYMEAKETHQDKTMQMKELEKYAQELTTDIVEMIEDATPEEKQYLSKKIATLANKITQVNG